MKNDEKFGKLGLWQDKNAIAPWECRKLKKSSSKIDKPKRNFLKKIYFKIWSLTILFTPTQHWIGKRKVINHYQDVPYRILEKQYTYKNGQKSDAPYQL